MTRRRSAPRSCMHWGRARSRACWKWPAATVRTARPWRRGALRLDATEGTQEGTALTARAIRSYPRARAITSSLPSRPPRPVYDAVIVAEILYYLSDHAMRQVARDAATWLRPGGTLVLAHHRIDFFDFAQHAAGIQTRFLAQTGRRWAVRTVRRTGKWLVWSAHAVADPARNRSSTQIRRSPNPGPA
jgi:hypothetical protein